MINSHHYSKKSIISIVLTTIFIFTITSLSIGLSVPSAQIIFSESGLPDGTTWVVTVNGVAYSSAVKDITVPAEIGSTYNFNVQSVSGFWINPQTGSVTLSENGSGVITRNIYFYVLSSTDSNTTTPTPAPQNSDGGSGNSHPSSPGPSTLPENNTTLISNSTAIVHLNGNITASQMTNFSIISNQSITQTCILFNLTGPSGTVGFSNMTITKSSVLYGTQPVIYIDNVPAQDQGYTQDSTNYYVWFSTHFSEHQVSIVFAEAGPTAIPIAEQNMSLTFLGIVIAVVILAVAALAFVAIFRRKKKKD
jgi:hypothetical protein